jgi:hypothetical protein
MSRLFPLLAGDAQGGEKALSIQIVPKNLFTQVASAHQNRSLPSYWIRSWRAIANF